MLQPTKIGRRSICALAACIFATGCNSSSGADTAGPVAQTDIAVASDADNTTDSRGTIPVQDVRSDALASITEQVILPVLRDFAAATIELQNATLAYSESPSDENRLAAQSAWIQAMDIWQHAEVMQIGPAGVSGEVAAGQDLRDGIYSWNIVNACRVDQETANKSYADPDDYQTKAVNVHGLDALEYLLFNEDTDNACNPMSSINENGTWNAISDVVAQRASHAATVANILSQRSAALLDLWEPNSGNFARELSGAGTTSMTYSSNQAALNALTDAMFYAEKTTKDMKLAIPLGISGCSDDICPSELESQYARRSKEHIRANLIAFQQLFLGGPADENHAGMDDILRSVGADTVADDITNGLVASLAAIDAIDGDLADALANNPQAVELAFNETRTVMTLFKTQFMATLNLEVPARAASDND